MDASFNQSMVDQSFIQQEEQEQDDFEAFENQGNQKKDWRELLQKDDQGVNQFHMNSKDQLFNQMRQSQKSKIKKPAKVSKERQALKAYHYLIKSWFLTQIMKCSRRLYNSSLRQRENTGKLLSAIGIDNVIKLIEARGKRPQTILETIVKVLQQSNFKALPNLIERTIYLLNFCQVECRILTLVNFQKFNLFDKFKIRNQAKKKQSKNNKSKMKQYVVQYVEESSQSESEQNSNFDDLDKYNFMSKKYVDHFVEKGQPSESQSKFNFRLKSDYNFYLRPNQWLQIYYDKSKSWKPINMSTFGLLTDDDIKKSIEGIATVFIYSCKIMNIKQQYAHLFQQRAFKNIQLTDETIRFYDGLTKLKTRMGKLDLRQTTQKVMKYAQFSGPDIVLNKIQQNCRKSSLQNIENIITTNYFPTTLYDFKTSKYFVIPSQLPKFQYLPPSCLPLPNLQFQGQKVYSRKDLKPLHSKYGWVDIGRMVKQQQISNPRKQTLTKEKKDLKLYGFDQTIKFQWKLIDNKFDKNQFGNIYINPYTAPPKGVIIIPQRVNFVCKKYNYEYAKVIQGFVNGHPNEIGFAIFQDKKQQILQLNKQRTIQLQQKKEKAKRNNIKILWKKLFKSILVTEGLKNRYQNKVENKQVTLEQ